MNLLTPVPRFWKEAFRSFQIPPAVRIPEPPDAEAAGCGAATATWRRSFRIGASIGVGRGLGVAVGAAPMSILPPQPEELYPYGENIPGTAKLSLQSSLVGLNQGIPR